MQLKIDLNEFFTEKTRILIVDDTAFNILGLKLILSNISNFIIDEAFNGQQAIDKIANSQQDALQYKLVFMDINMPVMDGYEASRIINQKIKEEVF